MLAFLVVVGLTAVVALQFGGTPAVSPEPSDLASVDGVIVGVESEGLGDVRSFDLRLADGTVDRCHVLISAVGFLNVPRYPDWPAAPASTW